MIQATGQLNTQIPLLQKLWTDLSRAQQAVREDESILERLSTRPWQSDDPVVLKEWTALTQPDNFEDLMAWGDSALNPRARAHTDEAISDCRRRLQVEPSDAAQDGEI